MAMQGNRMKLNMAESAPSFRHGLPESSLQGCIPATSDEEVCHPWTLDAFDTSLYLTFRATELCKSAVLPICPIYLIGLTVFPASCDCPTPPLAFTNNNSACLIEFFQVPHELKNKDRMQNL